MNIDRTKSLIDQLLSKSLENKNGSIHKIGYKNSSNNELLTDIEIKKYLNDSINKFLSKVYIRYDGKIMTKKIFSVASSFNYLTELIYSKSKAFHIERIYGLLDVLYTRFFLPLFSEEKKEERKKEKDKFISILFKLFDVKFLLKYILTKGNYLKLDVDLENIEYILNLASAKEEEKKKHEKNENFNKEKIGLEGLNGEKCELETNDIEFIKEHKTYDVKNIVEHELDANYSRDNYIKFVVGLYEQVNKVNDEINKVNKEVNKEVNGYFYIKMSKEVNKETNKETYEYYIPETEYDCIFNNKDDNEDIKTKDIKTKIASFALEIINISKWLKNITGDNKIYIHYYDYKLYIYVPKPDYMSKLIKNSKTDPIKKELENYITKYVKIFNKISAKAENAKNYDEYKKIFKGITDINNSIICNSIFNFNFEQFSYIYAINNIYVEEDIDKLINEYLEIECNKCGQNKYIVSKEKFKEMIEDNKLEYIKTNDLNEKLSRKFFQEEEDNHQEAEQKGSKCIIF